MPSIAPHLRQLGLLVLAASWLMCGCELEQTSELPPVERFPSSVAYNATTEFLSGSIVTTRIRSKQIVSYSDQDSSWALELNVDFYDSVGIHTSSLRSDSALIREQKRRLEVFGNVLVETDEGTQLKSEHMAWNDSSRIISTDSFVVVTRGDDVMSGYGFQSDPELNRIIFRRQVSGKLADPQQIEEQSPAEPPRLDDSVSVIADTLGPAEEDSRLQNGSDTISVSLPED